jgi:eukaryotic-like serine/threonine-protein kinase
LTQSGKAIGVAISPNGQYVVYVLREGELQSLNVRQVVTGSDVQILPPAQSVFDGLTFSPDGNYIYFVESTKDNQLFSFLYKMPVLGGSPQQVVRDIDTSISFSPDGKQFAFVRGVPEKGEVHVLVANADGSGEQLMAARKASVIPTAIFAPAWSPDGKTIVFSSLLPAAGSYLSAVSVADKTERQLYAGNGDVGRPQWLPDGSGVLLPMRAEGPGNQGQLWTVSFPGGERQRLTNDLTDYNLSWVDLTRDGSAIVTVESTVALELWSSPNGDAARSTQLTSGNGSAQFVSILSKDRILFSDRAGEVFSANYDGTNQTQIAGSDRGVRFIQACGDGKHVVYGAVNNGDSNIWRMDADGSNPTQMTHEKFAVFPECAPDGQSFIYWNADTSAHWRMGIEGGTPTQLSLPNSSGPVAIISRDNKVIAYSKANPEAPQKRAQVVGVPVAGGPPIFAIEFPPGTTIGGALPQWSLDGHAIDFPVLRGGAANLWRQPVPNGEIKQITNFTTGVLRSAVRSPDGKTLFTVRGSRSSDIILLKNEKK